MSDFFDEFMKDPNMEEVSGGDFKTIARAKVQPCFQGWANGTSKLFPYDGGKQAAMVAREKCADYCEGEKSYPQAGMLTTVYGDDIPTHPEGYMNDDWYDFVPVFHAKDKYTGQVNVSGKFPYDLVITGVKANRSVFNDAQWCQLSRPIDNVREPGRDKETSRYSRRVYVVEKVFAGREEAYVAAGKDASDTLQEDFGDFGGDAKGLSKTAIDSGWTIEALAKQQDKIWGAIITETGKKGPDGLAEAKQVVCENYTLSVSDLELIPQDEISEDEVPF